MNFSVCVGLERVGEDFFVDRLNETVIHSLFWLWVTQILFVFHTTPKQFALMESLLVAVRAMIGT